MKIFIIWILNTIFYSFMMWDKTDLSWTLFGGEPFTMGYSAIPYGAFVSGLTIFCAWLITLERN